MAINIKDIKNRINQIRKNKIKFVNLFPYKSNMGRNKFRKFNVSVIFIDISEFTQLCEEYKDKKDFYINLRCFHEGILDIFKMCGIKNIDIQGDGVFGIVRATNKNNENERIFDSALYIKGFLDNFLKYFDYRISISSKKENVAIVGRKDSRELVYFGGCVNHAKKLNQFKENNNCIIIDDDFYNTNKVFLNDFNIVKKDSYCLCWHSKGEWGTNEKNK